MNRSKVNRSRLTGGAFTNVAVWEADCTYDRYDRPQLRSCYWCGAAAIAFVSRTGVLSGYRYTDPACTNHSLGWLPRDKWDRL